MKILLTNDDGVKAPGIRKVFDVLNHSYDVTVVAPAVVSNASSHSITLKRPLKIKRFSPKIIGVYGTPTDCVILGVYELLESRPDMIVSGINSCANLGEDVSYSGTVGAALEGATIGIPSLAVSFYNEDRHSSSDFESAIEFIMKTIELVKNGKWNKSYVLNANIPYAPRGIKVTRLGKRGYEDVVSKQKNGYLIGGVRKDFVELGTDIEACKNGYISVTPLAIDLTDYDAIDFFKEIF